MLIDSGVQTQVNSTAAQEELLFDIVDFSNGTRGFVYTSLATLGVSITTSLIMRLTDASGTPTGGETVFAMPASGFAGGEIEDIQFAALSNGNFAIVYSDYLAGSTPNSPSTTAVRFQIYSASGTAIGSPTTIANGQVGGFVGVQSVTENPAGGFAVSIFDLAGMIGPDSDLFNVSNTGVVSAEVPTGTLAVRDVAYSTSGAQILGGIYINGTPTLYSVDFPGSNPIISYVPSSNPSGTSFTGVINTGLQAESATSAVVALEYVVGLSNPNPSIPPTVTSRTIQIIRFTDGQAAQLLTTITLANGTLDSDNFQDFIRLADGSFVLALYNEAPNGIGTSELRHISSTGLQLGVTELLNPAGQGAGAVVLTQLTDGRVMAGYSGLTTATGTDIEVFRELFTLSGSTPSTTPTNGADSLTGTAGADVINGLDGNDTILGLDGNDTLTGGAGNDSIVGGVGNDVINFGFGDTVSGGDGDDTMILTGPYTTDMSWNGGAGYDIFDASGAGIGLNNAGGTGLTFTSTERGIGTAFADYFRVLDAAGITTGKQFDGNAGNDTLEGGNQNDTLNGGADNDILIGRAGTDLLDGGTGADSMEGGADGDFYYTDNVGDVITEAADGGFDYVYASTSFTNWANVEYVIATGGAALTATGNGDGNTFDGTTRGNGVTFLGLGGADVLYGSNYADSLDGGMDNDIIIAFLSVNGADTLAGGAGDDVYFLFETGDTIIEQAGGGFDTVYTQANATLFDNVEQVIVYGAATSITGNSGANNLFGLNSSLGLTLNGLAGNDWIIGSNFDDVLNGGADNDILQGLTGTNTLSGGAGDDVYYSVTAGDVIVENTNDGRDTVYANYNVSALAANVEQLVSYGGATIGNGNGLDNTLYGNNNTVGMSLDGFAGADLIFGAALADTIIGGLGDDILVGLGGADRFAYSTAGNMGADTIIDFTDGADLIDLTGRGYGAGDISGSITIANSAGSTLITFNTGSLAGTTVLLASVSVVNVAAADFVF